MDYFDNYPLTGIKSSGWAPKPDPALPKYCAKCNEPMTAFRAKWLCDLVDDVMDVLPEPLATDFGDDLVFGFVAPESLETSTDIERVVLCDNCTLNAIKHAVTL